MKKINKPAKTAITIILAVVALLLIGWGGQLDHDEYIEANSTPVVRVSY